MKSAKAISLGINLYGILEMIDPVKYELFYNRLSHILNESRDVIRQLSASVIVREAGETAQVVCLMNGEAILISPGLLLHVNSVTRTIRYMLENRYSEDIGFYDGDQFINNDAHIGGMHRPDMIVVAPFFYQGQHIGWIGNYTHILEIGAIEPGGMPPTAEDCYHEGIFLPCIKLVEKGRIRRDIMQMMTRAVRDPRTIEIDTKAKIGGNERTRRNLTKLIDDFGLDIYAAASEQLVNDAEKEARAIIKARLPGKYRSRVYSDFLTPREQGLRVIEIEMEITAEGVLSIRTPLISPQERGFNNCALPGVEGAFFCVALSNLFYKTRWNGGLNKIVKLDIPEGSMLNASYDAALAYSPVGVGLQFMAAMNEVFSRAAYAAGLYYDVLAPCSVLSGIFYGGFDQYGRICGGAVLDGCASGGGARYDKDGADSSVSQFNPWNDLGDIEGNEALAPLLSLGRLQVANSGGFGKYRGGAAGQSVLTPWGTKQLVIGCLGMGGYVSLNQGLFGGYPAPAARLKLVQKTNLLKLIQENLPLPHQFNEVSQKVQGEEESLYPALMSRPVQIGDIITITYCGGGGLGDPLERDPEQVKKDLENQLTTFRAARNVYYVAIDQETMEIDYHETQNMREEQRQERKRIARPARDYLKDLIDRRARGDLPGPVLSFFQRLKKFSAAFEEQLKEEEKVYEKLCSCPPWSNNTKIELERKIISLTPYVSIFGDKGGTLWSYCTICQYLFGPATENYKYYCLIHDRDPFELYRELAPDKDWMLYREFYCPQCLTQIEVESCPPGMPILHQVELAEPITGS